MKLNADFQQRVVIHSSDLPWIDSPMAGVTRRSLDRVGEEVARATTIVRYAPGSKFSPHVHTGGEEFIVLDGVFQDEHGDFPAGSYIRNPPQSRHQPGAEEGCVIFVKLWQFHPEDRTHVRLNFNYMQAVPHRDLPGVSVTPLYEDAIETVAIYTLAPKTQLKLAALNGAELLVLDGSINEGSDKLNQHSWLRSPQHSEINAIATEDGATLWVKLGNLNHIEAQIKRVMQA